MAEKKVNPLKEIIASLGSKDDAIVLKTLDRIRKTGNEEVIEPLVKTWATTKNPRIHDEITSILYNLRDERAIAPLVKSLKLPEVGKHRAKLLSAFWNMLPDATEHIDVFAKIAVEGDYMECLECLTIIENLDSPFQEEVLLEALITLNKGLKSVSGEKAVLLEEMRKLLSQINNSL